MQNNYDKWGVAYAPGSKEWGYQFGSKVSAFTVAELGEMLPWGLHMDAEGQNGEALTTYKDSANQ